MSDKVPVRITSLPVVDGDIDTDALVVVSVDGVAKTATVEQLRGGGVGSAGASAQIVGGVDENTPSVGSNFVAVTTASPTFDGADTFVSAQNFEIENDTDGSIAVLATAILTLKGDGVAGILAELSIDAAGDTIGNASSPYTQKVLLLTSASDRKVLVAQRRITLAAGDVCQPCVYVNGGTYGGGLDTASVSFTVSVA